jgi:hypothetical protein
LNQFWHRFSELNEKKRERGDYLCLFLATITTAAITIMMTTTATVTYTQVRSVVVGGAPVAVGVGEGPVTVAL